VVNTSALTLTRKDRFLRGRAGLEQPRERLSMIQRPEGEQEAGIRNEARLD